MKFIGCYVTNKHHFVAHIVVFQSADFTPTLMKRTESGSAQLKLNLHGNCASKKTATNVIDLNQIRILRNSVSEQKISSEDTKIIDAFKRHAKKLDW